MAMRHVVRGKSTILWGIEAKASRVAPDAIALSGHDIGCTGCGSQWSRGHTLE